jgi:membrane protein
MSDYSPRGALMQIQASEHRTHARFGDTLRIIRRSVFDRSKQVWASVLADDCLDLAAQMSFYFVLALFPFLLVIAAIVGWLPSTTLWPSFAQWLIGYLPLDLRRLAFTVIFDLTRGYQGYFSLGLLVTLWTASSGFVSLMESLSVAYGVKETRSFLRKRAIAVCATVVAAIFSMASFAVLNFGRWAATTISGYVGSNLPFSIPWELVRWPVELALMLFGLDLIRYYLPDRAARWRWWTPGTLFAALAFVGATAAFNLYLRYFDTYPKLYGTLAGFIILLTWIYISNFVLLAGAELDHVIQEAPGPGASR